MGRALGPGQPVAPAHPARSGTVPDAAHRRRAPSRRRRCRRPASRRARPAPGSLDDIGAAAGIAGPSVNNHFDSKIDVLSAALVRGNEALWLGLHRALSSATDPADGLARLVADYAGFAAADPALVGILISEIIHLGAEARAPFIRAQRAYVTEWTTLLQRVRPDRDADEIGVLVRAAITLVNSLSRIHHLRGEPGHTARTTALALAVLHA